MRTALALMAGVMLAAGGGAEHPCIAAVAKLRAEVEAREAHISKLRQTVVTGLASADPVVVAMAREAQSALRTEEAVLIEEQARLGRNEDRCNELVWADTRGK